MSDFDDDNNWHRDDQPLATSSNFSTVEASNGNFSNVDYCQIINDPVLSQIFGYSSPQTVGSDIQRQEINMNILWMFVLVQAIGVGVILFFTFTF